MKEIQRDNLNGTRDKAVSLFQSLTFSLLMTGGLYILMLPVWARPDDPTMGMVIQGVGFVSQPTPYVPFTNIILGKLLVTLGQLSPNVFWYGTFVVGLTFNGLVIGLFSAFNYGTRFIDRLIGFLVAVFVFSNPLVFVTFTKTSIIVSFASLLMLFRELRSSEPNRLILCWGIASFAFSSLLRFEGSILSLLFLSLVALAGYLCRYRVLYMKRIVICILVLISLSAAFRYYHIRAFETDPDWKNYFRTSSILANFLDFNRDINDQNLVANFRTAGINSVEVKLLMSWFFPPQMISDQQIFEIAKAIPRTRINFVDGARALFIQFSSARETIFLIIVTLLIFTWLLRLRFGIFIILLNCSISLLLLIFMKLPERVFVPLCGMLPLSAVHMLFDRTKRIKNGWTAGVIIFCLVYMNISQIRFIKRSNNIYTEVNSHFMSDLDQLGFSTETIYIWRNDALFVNLPVIKFPSVELSKLNLIALGWLSRSGYSKARIRQLKLDSLFVRAIDSDQVLWVSDEGTNQLLQEFFQTRHQVPVKFELVKAGNTIQVWRARRRS